MIRLTKFIRDNLDEIVSNFAEFARSNLPPAESMGETELRDGAASILRAIVADMSSEQPPSHLEARAQGLRPEHAPAITSTAVEHAKERLRAGFSLADLISEYRALRSNVAQTWMASNDKGGRASALSRFNDALDQSMTEAVRWFDEESRRLRDVFVGVLGHDLRDPVSTAMNCTEILLMPEVDEPTRERTTAAALRSLARIAGMIDYLLDFARTNLGDQLPISPAPMSMSALCQEIVEAAAMSAPHREILLLLEGEVSGIWDAGRIKQALMNLVRNAIVYGDDQLPVTVTVQSESDGVALSVHNHGRPISPEEQLVIFKPLTRGVNSDRPRKADDSLGLGLFVVEKVAEAHGGGVEILSNDTDGTKFTLRLPAGRG